jgi:hypothetical protein
MNTTTTDEAVEADEANASAIEDYSPGVADNDVAAYPGDEEVEDEDEDAELGYSRADEEDASAPGHLLSSDPGWSGSGPALAVSEEAEPFELTEDSEIPGAAVVPESFENPEADMVREVPEAEAAEISEVSEFPSVAEPLESGHDVSAAVAVDEPLLGAEFSTGMLGHWNEVQVSFVEDPRASVQAADALVREIHEALVAASAERLDRLAGAWDEGSDTEQLRLALRQYRSFIGVILPR